MSSGREEARPAWLEAVQDHLAEELRANRLVVGARACMIFAYGRRDLTRYAKVISRLGPKRSALTNAARETLTVRELALEEIRSGFATFWSQRLLATASALEFLVRDLLSGWLSDVPDAAERAERDAGIPRTAQPKLSADEWFDFLVERLDNQLRSAHPRRVDRLFALLERFGLMPILSRDAHRDLVELFEVRNVIAHRRGIVDQRLLYACPNLALSPGQRLRVTEDDIVRYVEAAGELEMGISNRALETMRASIDG